MKQTILFLGPEKSPLLTWLVEHEEAVIWRSEKITANFIDNNNVTWLISYGYRHILTKELLDRLPDRAINLHISYLPFNRGADPNFWSFVNNTPKGVTIHYIDTGMDTGDIIVQRQVVFTEETLATTYQRLQTEIQELFKENWASIKAGTCGRTKQSHKATDKNVFSQLLRSGWDTNVSVIERARREKVMKIKSAEEFEKYISQRLKEKFSGRKINKQLTEEVKEYVCYICEKICEEEV